MVFDGTQDLGQLSRAELAGSTSSVAVSGETCLGHVPRLSGNPTIQKIRLNLDGSHDR